MQSAALGIDNLEHGIVVDTEFYPGKKPDVCSAHEAEEDFAKDGEIGSIAAGKAADLVVIAGNPVQNIDDVGKVEMVFKDGLGYDPVKLIQSVQGLTGLR